MLTSNNVLQHMLYATNPTFAMTVRIMALIIISFNDWYRAIEDDEKPVLYVHASSRMDLDLIVFIDEEEYKEYDVWAGDHPDICKRYGAHARYVKPFRYDDLKFISDVER